MSKRASNSDLSAASHWPPADEAVFHAMTTLPATQPVHEVLAFLDALPASKGIGRVPQHLIQAIDALGELEQDDRIHDAALESAGGRALRALRDLERELTSQAESRGRDVDSDDRFLSDPKELIHDLRTTIAEFARAHLESIYKRVASFSMILMTEEHHDGALAASFRDQRSAWKRALQPPRRGTPDYHLAVVPPPTAVDGVHHLAAEFGCESQLPCVIFLGTDKSLARAQASVLARWTVRRLEPEPPGYLDQITQIYRTVYAESALLPGSRAAAIADRIQVFVKRALNPKVALRMLAGAAGGTKLVEAAELIQTSDT